MLLLIREMDLKKFLPKKEDADKKEYFWSIIIEPGYVQAGIWRIEEEKAQIVLYSPPFSWEVEEDLVTAADNALSSAIQGFPDSLAEPQKTVFGVTSSWVSEGQIKPEFLSKIKVVCSELSLTPIGFVVLPEAIAHLIKAQEGSPLNAVVLGVYKEILEITFFKLGSLLGTTEVSRSVSVVDDVAEGLVRFGVKDPIPSRILLYNGREGELEEVRQSLLKVNWEDDTRLRFLHTPKVEIIEAREKIFAVSLAGASEMASVTSVESLKTEPDSVKTEEEEKEELSRETVIGQEENFAEGDQNLTPEDLGFSLEKDIAQGIDSPQQEPDQAFLRQRVDEIHRNVEPVSSKDVITKSPRAFKLNIYVLTSTFTKIKEKFAALRLPKSRISGRFAVGGNRLLVSGLAFFIILLLIGGVAWWSLPRATVTVYVSPKRLEEEFNMSVDVTKGSSDFSQKILAGETIETKVSGDKTKDATGTKTVGDKAKGEVTLYRVGSQITIPGGTVLHGPEDLQFALDSEVTVASGSAGSAGTIKALVVAEDIGAQYNLASGTTFRVGNYTSFDLEAKNEASFSGGSSREITAVSSEDQKVLEEDLSIELKGNAKKELLGKVSEGHILIEESLAATTSSRTFSNKEGDEAETLKLSLGVEASAVSIQKEEIVKLASEVLKDKVPGGFVLRGDQIDFGFNLEDSDSKVYEFEVRISANLLPEVNTEVIETRIRGRNPDVAEEYLNREVPGFVRAEIKLRPELPTKLKTLPHVAKNIEVEVAAER
ncbi:hypothetical protein A2715_03210 [Candidatus Woesebacteria bacterium RIFCSPHIGHO2_01_FULL_39_32]|uniref:Baseplate protein J-like barrel domain-containing protein n=2 Tax=Candidatus Woeseibacteriota TaxID=1752722 RepID=A0A0G0PYW3_9BACT|nr:MAG: hypothetical protein UT61_C0009G0004 [Candidatus Woesebacteria bacterium GW2011_GWA1_39_8]OGM04367.1 MAG: hypothetical protein A2124_02840 [Candidatus Woesebacteria bacterium GWB1_37_5]OGM24747.1 MAG: hypothetical protein A2715_03210 [Candidatus Woesebacteria bacterium RIFCSPHIGHO2_01_FULL_39_32]OGM38202.1 MAG: hypothetical protein A3F01_00980 [Candidatus Woesebacteria bacterium RIFCSPHIGHO2_12_FULL_38_11]OGM64573.1 MAG: hypothetical protein A2893_06125 [Candidatus Woesebacteria bacteri